MPARARATIIGGMKTTKTLILCIVLALTAQLALVANAGAANFCVGSSPECTGSPQPDFSFDRDGLLAAIAAAKTNAGEDTIRIAEGEIPIAAQTMITDTAAEVVHLVGAGAGKTRFVTSTASIFPLYANFANTSSTFGGFSLTVEGSPSMVVGVTVVKGTVHDFAVSETGGSASNFRAISLGNDGKIERASVQVASAGSTGILAHAGGGSARDVSMQANGTGHGVSVSSTNTFDFARLKIKGYQYGIHEDGGTLTLTDSLIDMGSTLNARGISAYNGNSGTLPIGTTVKRTTIVGSGNNQRGLYIGADSPNEVFTGSFEDLVLYGTGTGFEAARCVGGGGALTADFYEWASNANINPLAGCSVGSGNRLDLGAVSPGFRDAASGDYRLRSDSPLIDAGEGDGTGLTDLRGLARSVDGNDDATTKVDLGAYEYQRVAPTASLVVDKTVLAPVEQVAIEAEVGDVDGDQPVLAWTVDGTPVPDTGNALITAFDALGDHTVALTATDETGLTAAASVVVTVQAPFTPPVVPPVTAAPTAKFTAKPKKSFTRIGRSGSAFKVTKAKKQPYLAVAFSGAAKAELTLESVSGKKLKKLKGKQLLKVSDSTKRIAFGGKFAGKKLKAGRYRVTITPIAADGTRGKAVSVTIRLR